MINKIFSTYGNEYPELVKISCKLNKAASDSATYLLDRHYKECALKDKGEFYHG